MVIQTGSVAMGSSHYLSRNKLQAVGYGSWGKTVNSHSNGWRTTGGYKGEGIGGKWKHALGYGDAGWRGKGFFHSAG